MGYVKLFKADKTFDLLPADSVIRVFKNGTTAAGFVYSTGAICTVSFANVTDEDISKIVDAITKIEGASGEGIAPAELSGPITGITPSRTF